MKINDQHGAHHHSKRVENASLRTHSYCKHLPPRLFQMTGAPLLVLNYVQSPTNLKADARLYGTTACLFMVLGSLVRCVGPSVASWNHHRSSLTTA